MDAQRYDAPIEQLIKDEIDRALAVEPSPAFLARVRERIAREPMAPAWNYLTMSAAVAAAMLAIATVVGVITLNRDHVSPPSERSPIKVEARAGASTRPAQESASAPLASHVDSRSSVSRRMPPAAPSRVRPEPEVLVAANDAEALRHFSSAVHDGAIDLTALLREAPQATTELQPLSDTALQWMTIDPRVEIVTISQGAMQ